MTAGNGKPCKRCGTSEWSDRGNCKQCARDRAIKWYKDNPEAVKEYTKRNKDSILERMRRWRKDNSETIKEYNRQWYEENAEAEKEKSRQWQRDNPDSVRKYRRVSKHRRKARVKGNGGSYTNAEWESLVEYYGGRCLCCGRDDVKMTVDHVIPLVLGGSSNIDNIQPLCLSCNTRKQGKHIDYRTKPGILRWIQGKLLG